MKRFFVSVLIFSLLIGPVMATPKCIRLRSGAGCSNGVASGKSDWSTTCDGVSVRGITLCTSASTESTGSANLGIDSVAENNTNCWCRLISPAMSLIWVRAQDMSSATACTASCAGTCMSMMQSNEAFRRDMVGNFMAY